MAPHRTLLTCTNGAVGRAVETHSGAWSVDQALADTGVTCLAADRAQRGVVYAGTRQRGLWRSDDAGASWHQLGLVGQHIKSLVVSPHEPQTLYTGTKPAGLYRSQDSGRTWHELEGFRRIRNRWWWFSPAEPPDLRAYVIAVGVSPLNPDVLLAGVEFGAVVRSEDGGRTWSSHRPGALRDCHALGFHPIEGRYAYQAGGSGGGASISRDGGQTWRKAGRGLAASYGIACAADGVDPEVWYMATGSSPMNAFGENPRVYLYRAQGDSGWKPIGWAEHPLRETPTVMTSIPGSAGELYLGTRKGSIWHTTDYGETWLPLPLQLEGVWHTLLVLQGST